MHNKYLEAKHTNKELIKKRWGEEVEKKDLLQLFYSAVDEFSGFGNSIERWLMKIKEKGF
jgi:hypothetical protein